MRKVIRAVALALLMMTGAGTAHAYIGPGLGAGIVGTVLGILGSILLAIGAVVYYPVKRFMRRRREAKAAQKTPDRR